jgi:alkanesulfonate monooxygenase SsuD/methylene tetrahydromethanopterin reductase-like flavin-dependent oxidoreductase (luciferase family)
VLSAIATVTDRLRLTASAVIAPLRHPLLLARELGILDLLSGGRLIVLPNVSWSRDDYAALGVPFSRRGRLFNEHPEIRRKLWVTSAMSHESEYSPSRTSPSSPRHTARMAPDCGSVVRACTTRWSADHPVWSRFQPAGQVKPETCQTLKTTMAAGGDIADLEMNGVDLFCREVMHKVELLTA